jgi:hypothetical protein
VTPERNVVGHSPTIWPSTCPCGTARMGTGRCRPSVRVRTNRTRRESIGAPRTTPTPNQPVPPVIHEELGYVLRVSDRTAAAMQLAAHFTAEAMKNSSAEDARVRLAEQLGFFDLAFRSIMGSTARGIIKAGSTPASTNEAESSSPNNRPRLAAS